MKKIILYLFFFITLFSGIAQQKASRFSLLLPPGTDSVQLAKEQLAEGINDREDTAKALRLLRSAAGIFHRTGLANEEWGCPYIHWSCHHKSRHRKIYEFRRKFPQ